jgi:hypothetical protein
VSAEPFSSFTAGFGSPAASGPDGHRDAFGPAGQGGARPAGPTERVAAAVSSSGLVDLIAAATPGRAEVSSGPGAVPGAAEQNPGPASGPAAAAGILVGTCIDDQHPTLAGRVLVRFADRGGDQARERELWLATLAHLPVRREDRVLLLQPGNWPELLVVGVIDGLRERTAATSAAAVLTLKNDETLEIRDQDGTALLTVAPTPAGPVLRLARADQRLEIAGRLAVAADAIALEARGEVTLAAGGDVVVTGEEIKLN